MEINYDPKADALSITIKKGKVDKTIELAPEINLDVDKKGNSLYLEIVGISEKIGKKRAREVLVKNLSLA
ncbi:MAG: DUF2283 domain-containing protein [Candidatus Pacebacteria bacterium]|jgi:uncharacterized protein YuzE|nr:DUF2283 domain-containing protein [Candidatus Paceibacterota bacterium]